MLILCNSVERNSHFHHWSFFGMRFLFGNIIENTPGCVADATEESGKTTTELEDEPEENCMPVYVRTINGKTIKIKCDRKQKAATESEKVERKTSIPRGRTYLVHQGKMLKDKKTMSLRILGGMEKFWTHSNQKKKEKRKGSWRKCVKVKRR